MGTIDVKDATGATVPIEKPLTPGRAAAASSRPVALSTEDFAALDGIETLIGTTNAALTTLAGYLDGLEAAIASTNALLTTQAGYLDGLETLQTAISGKLPATLGQKAMAASLAVAFSSDQSPVGTFLAAASNASNTAYATNLVIKASAGTLYGLSGYNSKTSSQFIQLHDAASLPADAAVPKVFILVPASSNFAIDFGPRGRVFATGIVICNSSTGPTKTIGSSDIWVDAQFI